MPNQEWKLAEKAAVQALAALAKARALVHGRERDPAQAPAVQAALEAHAQVALNPEHARAAHAWALELVVGRDPEQALAALEPALVALGPEQARAALAALTQALEQARAALAALEQARAVRLPELTQEPVPERPPSEQEPQPKQAQEPPLEQVTIYRTPGFKLLRLAKFLFSPKIYSTVLEPTIRDLQDEHTKAQHRLWKAHYVCLRGYCAFWSAIWAHCSGSLVKKLLKALGAATSNPT